MQTSFWCWEKARQDWVQGNSVLWWRRRGRTYCRGRRTSRSPTSSYDHILPRSSQYFGYAVWKLCSTPLVINCVLWTCINSHRLLRWRNNFNRKWGNLSLAWNSWRSSIHIYLSIDWYWRGYDDQNMHHWRSLAAVWWGCLSDFQWTAW